LRILSRLSRFEIGIGGCGNWRGRLMWRGWHAGVKPAAQIHSATLMFSVHATSKILGSLIIKLKFDIKNVHLQIFPLLS
jgi:hypothetical protein